MDDEDVHPDVDKPLIIQNEKYLFVKTECEIVDILCAGIRVVYTVLRFGNSETRNRAKQILGEPETFRMLACLFSGTPLIPLWHHGLLGAKFMAICYEICRVEGIQRSISFDHLEVYAVVSNVARRLLATIRYVNTVIHLQ